MKKILKRSLAILLCLTMIFNYSFSVLADENVESSEPETTYTETIETTESNEITETPETTESIEESESEGEESDEEVSDESSEVIEEPEEDSKDTEEAIEEEPEEDSEELVNEQKVEDITEEIEEADISSPSEITDEENEENSIPEDMEEEPEEDELVEDIEGVEELSLLGSIASPSEIEENEEVETEEEVEKASPSELEMPMLLGAPTLFGDPAPTDHCKIGSQGYATLQMAIDAVNNNETIIMLDNVTYGASLTINNGKTFTIDFNDGSTSHTFTWDVTSGPTINRNIFAIGGNSNVTVKNMKFLAGGSAIQGNRIFEVNSTGTLTLYQMESNDEYGKRNIPVLNNGGIVYIDGGNITTNSTNSALISPNASNPVVQNLGGTTTFKGNGTYTMQNSGTGAAWLGRVITLPAQSTDADRDSECGTVIIENGTFNTGQIVDVNGKGTITINDATYGTGNGPIIKAFHGGIKSNITINNITTSAVVFSQVIEELETKINFQNGNVKYTPTRFCINQTGSAAMTSVSIKNGKFGPNTGSDDIHDEINNLLASGATLTALTGDPDGYTYKVETPPPVCKIGTTEYTSLEAAITAATSGQTITLLSDITYTVGPNFVIDGKTVTIDFDGHSLTTDIGSSSSPSGRDIFTVTNTGNLTVKNGTTVCICMYGNLNPFKTIGANSKLTLIDMTQATKLSGFLTMNGGTATINGGTFGTSGSSQQITLKLSNNATLNLVNNPQFYFQSNLFVLGNDATDPDTLAANVKIDSGTFNSYNNGSAIIYASGKSNVTINGGTYITTGTNTTSTPIFINTYGYKSNITINNFTSNSGQVFRSNCPNISEFAPKINNGHYKYIKGKFALDNDGTSKPNVKLNGGYFGPDITDDDALAELTSLCVSGKNVETLESSDPEYANGYRYKIAADSPSPTPTPTPYHGGGSSGGGGGGAGIPRYDLEGNILGPSGILNNNYDGTNPPNLTGNITVSHWDYNTANAQVADIHYVQNIDSFVRGNNNPVITEWVGITTNTNQRVLWYRTNANGQILRNQFIQIGNNIYYFDNNGIMVTGQHTINGKVYNFETAVGATEGRFLY